MSPGYIFIFRRKILYTDEEVQMPYQKRGQDLTEILQNFDIKTTKWRNFKRYQWIKYWPQLSKKLTEVEMSYEGSLNFNFKPNLRKCQQRFLHNPRSFVSKDRAINNYLRSIKFFVLQAHCRSQMVYSGSHNRLYSYYISTVSTTFSKLPTPVAWSFLTP
jgi:hypothetical protein